jgi:predicted dehydrogenase
LHKRGQMDPIDVPLRLAIVGCGRVVERFHLPALQKLPAWRITGACDPSAARRAWAEQAMSAVPVYTNIERLLGEEEHDAVLVASPMHRQAAAALQALGGGLHVLVEKPGGMSVGDAQQLRAAAIEAGKLLWVGYNRRFRATYQTVRERIAQVRIGTGTSIRSELGYSLREWDPVSGMDPGGIRQLLVAYDVAVHQIDLLPWLAGGVVEAIKTIGLMESSPGLQELEYALRLTTGVEAGCVAGHRTDYRETLEVTWPGWRAQAFPTGILISRRVGHRLLQRMAGVRNWTDRKLIRLGLRTDDLSESYRRQLSAFSAAIRGETASESGADAQSLLHLHACLEALKQSMHVPGVWVNVNSDVQGA